MRLLEAEPPVAIAFGARHETYGAQAAGEREADLGGGRHRDQPLLHPGQDPFYSGEYAAHHNDRPQRRIEARYHPRQLPCGRGCQKVDAVENVPSLQESGHHETIPADPLLDRAPFKLSKVSLQGGGRLLGVVIRVRELDEGSKESLWRSWLWGLSHHPVGSVAVAPATELLLAEEGPARMLDAVY
eukprot:7387954-Prymnesium_polylepis.1